MSDTKNQSRVDSLVEAVSTLRSLIPQLPSLKPEVEEYAGVAARLGLRIIERGTGSVSVALRRHEMIGIPETVTLLDHIVGLKKGGVTPPDMNGIRDLLDSRKSSLQRSLMSADDMDMVRIEPGLDLGLRTAKIDGKKAIQSFLNRTGNSSNQRIEDDISGTDIGTSLFTDYMSDDLPEEDRDTARASIDKNDRISRYTHDELIVITKLREIVQKIDGYGYGVASRRRPMFSQARRNVLWSVPRVGAVMACHIPSWRRQAEIGPMLLDLRRYEQHMQDLAMIPEDDDWFDGDDPLVKAVRRDAWMIHRRGLKIVEDIRNGPSAHRFDKAFFEIFPGSGANYTGRFIELCAPVVNAMAFAGVCGKGERDRALTVEQAAEVERVEIREKGLLSSIRDIFT
jgi:hypothetical protein